MKLVHDDGKIPAIFFPAGRLEDGGTCEFATKICLERCPSDINPTAIEREVYKQFVELPADEVAQRIHMELLDRNKLHLHWFTWGDCPSKMTQKIAWIVKKLAKEGVTQSGFTRNEKLWSLIPSNERTRFVFTLENEDDVLLYCDLGWVCVPDYERAVVRLFYGTKREQIGSEQKKVVCHGSCSGQWMTTVDVPLHKVEPELIHEADCTQCAVNARGCFNRSE